MKTKICFFLSALVLISVFYVGPVCATQQEEFSLNAFARTYGKSLGDLAYNSMYDFNCNNSIDNYDLEVCISNTPLKSLSEILSVSKKTSRRRKKLDSICL